MKKILILINWTGPENFNRLKSIAEHSLKGIYNLTYLVALKNHKEKEQLLSVTDAFSFSLKDFTLFGGIKNKELTAMITGKEFKALVITETNKTLLINRLLKSNKLCTVGISESDFSALNLRFENAKIEDGSLFENIKKYLNKIELA